MSGERHLAEKRREPEPVGSTSAFSHLAAPTIDMIICPCPDAVQLGVIRKKQTAHRLGLCSLSSAAPPLLLFREQNWGVY